MSVIYCTIPHFAAALARRDHPEWEGGPLVLIGPGTGVAPLRAFLQHRSLQRAKGLPHAPHAPPHAQAEPVPPPSRDLLFFGCQSPEDDLYANELDSMPDLDIIRAYMSDPVEPTFVQHHVFA